MQYNQIQSAQMQALLMQRFFLFFFLKLVQFEKALFHLYIESRHILLIYLYKTFADNYF